MNVSEGIAASILRVEENVKRGKNVHDIGRGRAGPGF
jgi:hypothetical protein